MLERKLYKTRLCVLYQRGHCSRQSCSFAHGDTELRGSFNGRRHHRDGDLRDTIDRRQSPERRYSPGRNARGRRSHHGYSPSRSLEKRSNRKRWKTPLLDGQSDLSGSLKISDGDADLKEKKVSSGSKDVLLDQLKQVQSDINMMDDHKCQLELDLEERVQEVNSLTSKLQELEDQLYKERDDCKRLTSKIKKFLKAHNRHLQIQDELKRSQTRLRKLGDQLGLDTNRPGILEEDLSISIVSDDEATRNDLSPQKMLEKSVAPSKKRSRINLNTVEEVTPWVYWRSEDGDLAETIRIKKPSRWNVDHPQINFEKVAGVKNNGNDGAKPNEANHKGMKNVSTGSRSADKMKVLDSGFVLPSTSMAAHAVDEVVETIEDEKVKAVGNASKGVEKGAVYEYNGLSVLLPPPPPLPPVYKNAYVQYKGDDENVDVEVHEEMEDVDIV